MARQETTRGRGGRKRDPSRDAVILDAALDVLAEEGFEGMTMDLVAARASAGKATVYRRWSSKSELVLDAFARMHRSEVDPAAVPDAGSLRGDLVGMMNPAALGVGEQRLRAVAGIVSTMARDPEFADAARAAAVEPWIAVLRLFFERAVDRGEIPADTDIDTIAGVLPSMAVYRVYLERKPLDEDFLLPLIDGVILPAVGLAATTGRRRRG